MANARTMKTALQQMGYDVTGSYITQRGAEAIYTSEGKQQVRKTIDYYMANARTMKTALQQMGYDVTGGENAPYLWVKTPDNLSSWQFFDHLLNQAQVIVTPGVGFGPSGEGYVRLTMHPIFGLRHRTIFLPGSFSTIC